MRASRSLCKTVVMEVGEDVAKVREYKGVACRLKIAMWRKEEYIGELKALGGCEGVVEIVRMAALPRCDELRQAAHSSEWEDMFILYYHRAIVEDIRLAREING
ncbi:hypothetical protein Tco_0744675 [Tanacetum coccineum]